ncbi:Major facilitator superfamily domain, general substrate transporter [Penicillium occitanis (nom. inval.)]|nr:hypothetical protein PENOC_058310 [Penicillium occitanis (nom. inval.)]PCH07331.1 Major facilitator superfamily domain, general substrate transporter [Penicillium occitanis (nom. inval.)]
MAKSSEDVSTTTQVVRDMESTEQMLEVDGTPSSTSTQDPPNGGLRAWLHVVASFCIYFNSYGISNSYGIFQTYYTEQLGFDAPKAAAIGSVQSFLMFFGAFLAGPLYDAGYYRYVLVTGSILITFGTFMQSISTQMWQFVLSQGICIGLGGGIISMLGTSMLSTYFTSKLPFASGIGTTGSGIAGILLPVLFNNLQPRIGYGWTVRVFGFMSLATLLVPVLVMRARIVAKKKSTIIDMSVFRDHPFLIFITGNVILILGAYIPFNYVESFAVDENITNANIAFYILAMMNFSSLAGKVLPMLLAPRIGPFNLLLFFGVATGASSLALLGVKSLATVIVVSVIYAFLCGAFFALQPVVVIGLCPDPGLIGKRIGMAFVGLSFGLLATSPIAGAFQDSVGFNGVWLWAGLTAEIGACIMIISRGRKAGWALKTKI